MTRFKIRPIHLPVIALCSLLFSAAAAHAWTTPPASPPNSNVSAPINVGATAQTKNGTIGVNGLAVFGDSILQASSYLNWGGTSGTTGYGIRDTAGSLEFKNSGGTWQTLQTIVSGLVGSGQWTTSGSNIYSANAGNVGIGSASAPGAKLEVFGNIRTTGSNVFAQNDNTSLGYGAAPLQVREAMYGATAGYLPPRISFHWGGVVASQIAIESDGTIAIRNNPGTGYEKFKAATIYGDGFFHNSDARLKINIQTSRGLEIILKLRGVVFNWKKDGTKSSGVIAQEVEEVMSETVHTNSEGLKSVDYDQLIAPLIEAVKEQQAQIESQQKKINAMDAEIQALRARQ